MTQRLGFSTTGTRPPAPTRGRADPVPTTRTINSIGIRTDGNRLVLLAGGQDVEPGATLTLPASAVTSLVAADRKARAVWLRTWDAKGMAPDSARDEPTPPPTITVPANVFADLVAALDRQTLETARQTSEIARQTEVVRDGQGTKRVVYGVDGKISKVVTEVES